MDPIEKRELKRKAWQRLAAQRRRAGMLRGRVVAISLVCFALLWGIVFVQMATGNDPVLSAKKTTTNRAVASTKSGGETTAKREREQQRSREAQATAGEEAEREIEAEEETELQTERSEAEELEIAEARAASVEAAELEAAEAEAAEAETVEPEVVEEPLVTSQS